MVELTKEEILELNKKLKLELKEDETIMAPVLNGIPFLGFRIFPRLVRIRRENLRRSLRKFKRREREYHQGRIELEKLKQSAGSVIAHMSHANSLRLRRKLFFKKLCEG